MTVLGGRAAKSATLLALDRSLRSLDPAGHMRVEESRITKANICPYLGREIPQWQALKLDPDRTYRLFRDPAELEKAAKTFEGKPLLVRHAPVDADLPQKDLWVGTIGAVTWEDPYLVSRPLTVLTQEAIDLIESQQQRELSAGYWYDALMEPGAWGGEQYDGKMVNIRGNHVAIVSEGRVGPDVHVADELPKELRMSRSVAAAVALAIKPYLGKDPKTDLIAMALDGMLGETPAESVISLDEAEKKSAEDEALAEKQKAEGKDAKLDDNEREAAYERARDKKRAKDKKARDAKAAKDKRARDEHEAAVDEREAGMDAKEEAEDEGKEDGEAKDRKRARDSRKAARDKRAKDRGMDTGSDPDHRKDFNSIKQGGADAVTKDELTDAVKAAVEATEKRAREAAIARETVRPLVGVVSMALDSAEAIYTHALKHAGVDCKDVHPSALGKLVELTIANRKTPAPSGLALDAATADLLDVAAIFGPKKAA